MSQGSLEGILTWGDWRLRGGLGAVTLLEIRFVATVLNPKGQCSERCCNLVGVVWQALLFHWLLQVLP